MAKIESTVTIARPVEDVFRFVLALEENAPKMDPGVESVVKTSHGPTGAGTTFRFRQKMLGRRRETTTRFISVEPNREIEFEARLGPIEPKAVLTFEQTDEGTRVTFRRAQPGRPAQVALSSLSLLSSPARVSRSGTRDWRGSRLCWRPPRPSFRRVRCRTSCEHPERRARAHRASADAAGDEGPLGRHDFPARQRDGAPSTPSTTGRARRSRHVEELRRERCRGEQERWPGLWHPLEVIGRADCDKNYRESVQVADESRPDLRGAEMSFPISDRLRQRAARARSVSDLRTNPLASRPPRGPTHCRQRPLHLTRMKRPHTTPERTRFEPASDTG